jgi:hypothetical protein
VAVGVGLADLAVVVAFVTIGRRSHDAGDGIGGYLRVLWPFAVASLVGWWCSGLARDPRSIRRAVVAWAVTVGLALALRILVQNHRLQVSFVAVAAIFIGLGMATWRAAGLRRAGGARGAARRGVRRGVPR